MQRPPCSQKTSSETHSAAYPLVLPNIFSCRNSFAAIVYHVTTQMLLNVCPSESLKMFNLTQSFDYGLTMSSPFDAKGRNSVCYNHNKIYHCSHIASHNLGENTHAMYTLRDVLGRRCRKYFPKGMSASPISLWIGGHLKGWKTDIEMGLPRYTYR